MDIPKEVILSSDRSGPERKSPWLRLPKLRQAWRDSLHYRLVALGLMPMLIAFPLVIAILVLIGGQRADTLMASTLRGNLAAAGNYLSQIRTETGVRIGQLVKSERLAELVTQGPSAELNRTLATAAQGSGMDFLLVANLAGKVIGSSKEGNVGARLPETYVTHQARLGVGNAAYERIEASLLPAFGIDNANAARGESGNHAGVKPAAQDRGLLINAAAHFPLMANSPDAILVGGILLNGNLSLIEHMREIIFPVGSLPGDAEGITAIYLEGTNIAVSRQRQFGMRTLGITAGAETVAAVLARDDFWIDNQEFGDVSYLVGYDAITDGKGQRIGMISVGFPDAPYKRTAWVLLGMIAALLALTMFALSLLFIRAGHDLTCRLARISRTMDVVRQGDREARVGRSSRNDEIGRLTNDFNVLLDTLSTQDEIRRAALQAVADEASWRRALFEHERDGVVILNLDGSVFEANPKCAAMLGYTQAELQKLRIFDWDTGCAESNWSALVAKIGPDGVFFESSHRRKGGETYLAELSLSIAQWGVKAFVLVLQRDISERKAAEAELDKYRRGLEGLVEQRTRELNERSEQLNAIFSLSPDGFVSFDLQHRVSFVNQAFTRITGLAADDVIGRDEETFSTRLAGMCVEQARFVGVTALRTAWVAMTEVEQASGEGRDQRNLFELAGPGGCVVDVNLRLSNSAGVSQILYFRDVTHETEVDRMKSEFLSAAAHELRTPMTSIYGFAELLLMQDFDAEMRREVVTTICKQSELMSSIINELLDLARIEARRGKDFMLEPAVLQSLVTEAVAGFKPPQERPVPQLAETGPPVAIRGDHKKIKQALLNVLSNAYKYSPQGGGVSIEYCHDGRRVGVAVRDRGIGMTPEQVARVFERFYRADESGNILGTGLGMSIVKEIIEIHGGTVEVDSMLGEGTTVTLWLQREDGRVA